MTGISTTGTVDYDGAAEELAAYGLDAPTAVIVELYALEQLLFNLFTDNADALDACA